MKLTEEQIEEFEGKEIDEIRKELEEKNYSKEDIKKIISQIDDWRIENAKWRLKKKQAFSYIVVGTVLSLVAATIFLFLYFRDEFKDKISMFTIILLMIGYLLIRMGRLSLKNRQE